MTRKMLLIITINLLSLNNCFAIQQNNSPSGINNLPTNIKLNSNVLYHYSTDIQGYRTNPNNNLGTKNKYAIFFGASYIFGDFVTDQQTMPYYFSSFLPNYRTYNYALCGAGPHIMLTNFSKKRKMHIKENSSNGIAVYVFCPHDIVKTAGTFSWVYPDRLKEPFFYLDKSGSLHEKGTMKTGRPLLNIIMYLCWHLNLQKYIDFPKLTEYYYKLTAAIINQIYLEYQKQFNNNNFYVLFYPGYPGDEEIMAQKMKDHLLKYNIKILDYYNMIRPWEKAIDKTNKHPTPYGNYTIMNVFSNYLMKSDQ